MSSKQTKAYKAWWWLNDNDYWFEAVPMRVDPETGEVTDEEVGSVIEWWFEAGQFSQLGRIHDVRLDLGSVDFEEGLIELANRVKEEYGKKPD